MKAVVCTKYGAPEVLTIQDVPKPSPKPNEVLIKIVATTVSSADCRVRSFNVPLSFWLPAKLVLGLFRPRKNILGIECAGIIESIGESVTRFKKGDQVFAFPGHYAFGTYAEYTTIDQNGNIACIPNNTNYNEAASLNLGGQTALTFLRKAGISQGKNILIYGASGSVGSAAVQIAKSYGLNVTGVCSSGNLDLVTSLGADSVIDYTTHDFTQMGGAYDIIFDTVGKTKPSNCIKVLTQKGVYLQTVSPPAHSIKMFCYTLFTRKRCIGGSFHPKPEDMLTIKELVEAEQLKPIIDSYYPLEQIVEAHRRADTGRKKGNIVITLS
ncbi:MAG: NAD(P)-dependent alcohol dehydrogenase [Fibrobacterales bacterium]